MIVYQIKIREELMISMGLKNQNNIINITDNNGEKVQLNKYSELSFHKMEGLMIYSRMGLVLDLEMVLEDFNLFKQVLECFIIRLVLEGIVANNNKIIEDKISINKNFRTKEDKFKEELIGYKFLVI